MTLGHKLDEIQAGIAILGKERDRYRAELIWLQRNLSLAKDNWDAGDIMTQNEARHRIKEVLGSFHGSY